MYYPRARVSLSMTLYICISKYVSVGGVCVMSLNRETNAVNSFGDFIEIFFDSLMFIPPNSTMTYNYPRTNM